MVPKRSGGTRRTARRARFPHPRAGGADLCWVNRRTAHDGAISGLLAALEAEGRALDALLFRLEELRLLLLAGDTRFVQPAAVDVVRSARRARAQDLHRAVQAEYLAARLEAPPELLNLPLLAEHVDEPHCSHLAAHAIELGSRLEELEDLVATTRDLAAGARAAILANGGGHDGGRAAVVPYELAAEAADRAAIPALRAFLGSDAPGDGSG